MSEPRTISVALTIHGLPAPQGSKTMVRNKKGFGFLIEGSSTTGRAKTKAWRQAVADTAALERRGKPPLDGPLRLVLRLRFPRPASRPKRHHGWHVVKPDKDKVLRATLDALVIGGLLRDDACVCAVDLEAREVVGWTGAEITVLPLEARP